VGRDARWRGDAARGNIEKRLAPKKVEIAVERFDVNLSKPELVRFPNEHSGMMRVCRGLCGVEK
jgi:hypothetical protein